PSTGSARLFGARGGTSEIEELEIADRYTRVPDTVPSGAPFNIAQLWNRFATGIKETEDVEPNFETAVKRHTLLEAIQTSSDTGRAQKL
ncbi:uncharacterized protein METZ01_LOCUS254799, partial [marine metagenome]